MELTDQEIFGRTERLLGTAGLERLRQTSVIIFGVGGVGSWCAESLIRSGVGRLTMVDPDTVQPSNINRQLMATTGTVGQPKAEVLRRRLLDISPRADIRALCTAYAPGCAADFRLGDYNYVVDAWSNSAEDATWENIYGVFYSFGRTYSLKLRVNF